MSFARFRTFRRRLGLLALFGALAIPAGAGAATAGDPVTWFNPVAREFGPAGAETASGVAMRADGRIVASIFNDAEYDRRIVGLLPDGTLDPSFSDDGIWHWPQAGNVTVVRAVATQADGKVVFVGDDHSQHALVVGRLMRDGELDPTFGGGDGFRVIATGDATSPYGEHVLVQSDGKVIFAGSVNDATMGRQLLLGRLNPDGNDDGTFAGTPFRTWGSAGAGVDDRFAGLTRLSNGEFIMASAHDGGSTGILRIGPTNNYVIVKDLQLSAQADQAVDVVAVDATHVAVLATGAEWQTAIARVTVDATPALDTSFGGGDGVATSFPAAFRGVQVLRQPEGKFVVAGFDGSAGNHRAFVRLDGTGALDSSFGSGGMALLPGTSLFTPLVRAHEFAFAGDGAIVSAGHVNADVSADTAIDRLVGRISRVRAEAVTSVTEPQVATNTPVTLRVTNDGPDGSGATIVSFETSPDIVVASADPACVFASASTGSCAVADIAPGTSRDLVLQVRRASAGSGTVKMAIRSTTFDDDPTNDGSTLTMPFGLPGQAPTTTTGPATIPVGPSTLLMTIRRVSAQGGRQLRCGFTGRMACVTSRVRTGVRTVPMWIRASSRPLPGTPKRRVNVLIQRLEKGRYVKRGTGTLDLRANGSLDLLVPNATRGSRSYWRWRIYVPATATTKAATSRWFYILVR